MTTTAILEKFTEATKSTVLDAFYSDTWRSTSYLINLLGKIERYTESLTQDNPDSDFYTAHVALSSAVSVISNTYNCPISDERFAEVKDMYEATVELFISEFSDDATYDLMYLGAIANYVAGMRVHAINRWIEETAPSESKFEALRLAKRDEKAVELAIHTLAEVIYASLS